MSWLSGLVGGATAGGVSGVLNGVGDAAIKLRTAITGDLPPDKKAEIELELTKLDAEFAKAQSEINKIEAQSTNLFVSGWRPASGWIAAFGFGYIFIAQPFLAWASKNFGLLDPPMIEADILLTLLFALLGMGTLRTLEKTRGVSRN